MRGIHAEINNQNIPKTTPLAFIHGEVMASMRRMALTPILFLVLGTAAAQHASPWYNDRALRQQLDTSVTSFFGSEKGQFVVLRGRDAPGVDQGLLATQFLGIFDGVPQDRVTTEHGYTLYSGCQPHNCAVTAAVLTESDGTVIDAAALIHWRCGRPDLPTDSPQAAKGEPFRVGGCDDLQHPTVTMFFARKAAVDEQKVQDLKDWAAKRLSDIGGYRKTRYVTVAFK